MKINLRTNYFLIFVIICFHSHCQNVEKPSKYVLYKENGRVILAYKAFEEYLNSEKSWKNYQKCLLEQFPEMQYLHKRNIKYHFIDSTDFREDVLNFSIDSFKVFLNRINDKKINELYDTIILK
jgi:hypothetical protein